MLCSVKKIYNTTDQGSLQYISGYIARKVSSYYTKPKSKNVASYLFSMDCQPGLLKKAPGSGDRVVLAVVWDL